MCKIQIPEIPANTTADEKRAFMFKALSTLNVNDLCEKRDSLTYLSWSNAWSVFKTYYPSATYNIIRNNNGLPYFSDPELGIMVFTEVTVDDVTHSMWLPVMDSKNKAMKFEPYTYQVWDNYKKTYVEKTVSAASMFDVNKTLMRCLVKNLAMFGLGLYIFQGDDLPENAAEDIQQPTAQRTTQRTVQPPVADKYAGIKQAINSANDVTSLLSYYLDHQGEIEANPEIKELLTKRKHELQKK